MRPKDGGGLVLEDVHVAGSVSSGLQLAGSAREGHPVFATEDLRVSASFGSWL